jgi:hypothetical protein
MELYGRVSAEVRKEERKRRDESGRWVRPRRTNEVEALVKRNLFRVLAAADCVVGEAAAVQLLAGRDGLRNEGRGEGSASE